MTKRLVTYIPNAIYNLLEKWAGEESRSISNLTAFILEKAVREEYEKRGQKEANNHNSSIEL